MNTPERIEEIKGFIRRMEPATGPKDLILQAYSDLWLEASEECERALDLLRQCEGYLFEAGTQGAEAVRREVLAVLAQSQDGTQPRGRTQ